jgi:hypothetical protein
MRELLPQDLDTATGGETLFVPGERSWPTAGDLYRWARRGAHGIGTLYRAQRDWRRRTIWF